MTMLLYLIPAALLLGGVSLVAFLWALRSGQYEDMDGAAERIFIEDEEGQQAPPNARRRRHEDGRDNGDQPQHSS